MADLQTRSFTTIVSNIAAGMQGRVPSFLNFAVGSVFRAIAEAYAGVVLWLQSIALSVMMLTRLQTSYGPDADSWIEQFGFMQRIGSVAATGLVTFGRFTASGSSPFVPVGALVRTADGSQTFAVYADTANPSYSESAGGVGIPGYVMPPQVLSLIVPVISVTPSPQGTLLSDGTQAPGANGNVAAGTISLIASEISSIDTVTNPAAFTNGSDSESDSALKLRFQQGVQSFSRATPEAIAFIVSGIRTGLQVQVLSGLDPAGNTLPGFTTVFVDDGSGAISDSLLGECAAAAQNYVASGIRLGVFKGSRQNAGVQLSIAVVTGYQKQQVVAALAARVADLINSSLMGQGVDYFTVGKWALETPGVGKIDNLTLNGGTADIPARNGITVKCSGVLVN